MIEKGATGSERDFEKVYEYLLRHYGVVSINLATTEDITTIVGLSKKDADAIVAYRKEKGPFADLEAVKKVPEIDVKKLDDHKEAVTF
jgi:competence protein ComEA